MKQLIVSLVLVCAVCSLSMIAGKGKTDLRPALLNISQLSIHQIETLDSFLSVYPTHFYDSSFATRNKKYQELAYYFKRAANFLVYFEPDLYYTKLIGPFQFERSEQKGFLGFVPDNWLFTGPIGNEPDSSLRKDYTLEDSTNQKTFITAVAGRYRHALAATNYRIHLAAMDESQLFDALRMEMFRISSIDIANADFIIEEAGLPSLNGSVESWLIFSNELVQLVPSPDAGYRQRWEQLQKGTRQFLAANTDFNSFDRMSFIKNHLVPLAGFLNDLQVTLGIPFLQKTAAVRSNARHIFDKEIFQADYFAPNKNATYSAARASLGELLFFDPILSGNNRRACASCHKPEMAFTDGKVKSVGFDFDKDLARNSPTVINSGFQKKLFWDQRAGSLEDQLDSVVNNVHELNGSFDVLVEKINASPQYVSLFYKAFPHTKKQGIGREDIKNAIGVYERTVTGLNSRFDLYMQGDITKLSREEINGFNVYMGKARCGNCHFAPLFNGAVPPFFDITDHKSLGVPLKDTMDLYRLDPDEGMFLNNKNAFSRTSFKTPTVRNAALTAPYMHNGIYKTLEQVVNFYDHAGGEKFRKDMKQGVKDLPFFTLIPLELKLTEPEKRDLVSFLKALTDTTASNSPTYLPEIKGKYAHLNKRTIGGEY